ncbi:MAG: D-aminoacyl-tRNA deacylase [Candidatus Hodarchaeales archaeon]|jgi:D-aminoacyl-tRNA deacylase
MSTRSEFPVNLLVSRIDIAGMNIQQYLNESMKKRVLTLENDSIYSDEEITKHITNNSDIIFLSRHSARSLRPSFTVHPIGNFGLAEFGGKEANLIKCNSFLLKKLLLNVNQLTDSENYKLSYEYEISVEATHHGPYSDQSIAFIEVGSAEPQWKDIEACRLIADAVNSLESEDPFQSEKWISSIGFGGNHYASKFTKLIIETEYALGHICAKYAISLLNENLVNQMIMNTTPTPKIAFFDKKSMKRKQEMREILAEFDIEVIQI